MKKYKINEIFHSIQGEGVRAGTANVFVRFSGCNLNCDYKKGKRSPGGFRCDTDFESGTMMDSNELLLQIAKIGHWDENHHSSRNIIFTGGEPTLQLDKEIIVRCQIELGAYLAIETNGTKEVPFEIDWICVSPKVDDKYVKQRQADEVKYVISYNDPLPKTSICAKYYLLSPASSKHELIKENIDYCIDLVKENPQWRLSCQLHKLWKVR